MTANLPAVAGLKTANIIEARDLVKSFGETPALRGASLTVRQGEIVAVMGPSGSGKSTRCTAWRASWSPRRGRCGSAGSGWTP